LAASALSLPICAGAAGMEVFMKKKIAVIHTSFVLEQTLGALFSQIMPEAEIINLVYDSILAEVIAAGSPTPGIYGRMCKYFDIAQSLGSDLIFNTCSATSGVAETASCTVHDPVLCIDEAMAEQAVESGERIVVVATVSAALEPSMALIEKKAVLAKKYADLNLIWWKGHFPVPGRATGPDITR